MSYEDIIEKILSDGRNHCILDLIAETGLSARNRISEMNKDYRIKKGYPENSKEDEHQRYLGSKCNLESCDHRSDLYMYRLNAAVLQYRNNYDPLSINHINQDAGAYRQFEQNSIGRKMNDKEKRQLEEWMKKTPEERKQYIQDLLIKGGIKHG